MISNVFRLMAQLVISIFVGSLCTIASAECAPQFKDYPAERIVSKSPSKIKMSSKKAYQFRTQLKRALHMQPNFAGHYILLTWGCGSPCHEIALVDAGDGRVYFAPFLGRLGEDFQVHSNLLILNPKPNALFDRECYVWKNKSFEEIACCFEN